MPHKVEMPYEVIRLARTNTHGNHHGVCRDETWIPQKVNETFKTEEEAKDFIRNKSLPYLVRFCCPPTAEFIEEFCFTNPRWANERVYFLGEPNWKEIRQALETKGVTVVSNKGK